MTIQQKHDALLTFCVRTSKDLDVSPQSIIRLDAGDVQKALAECEFRDEEDLRFYVKSLVDRDLLESYVTGAGVAFRITMAGYELADGARPAISQTETGSRFVERRSEDGPSNEEDRLSIKPTAFRVPKNTSHSESSLLVAVMIPFQKEFDSVYEIINMACSKLGFTVRKVDDMWQDQTIIQDIFTLLCQADIVIADFSGSNPNVMYETGIAHTLGKIVIPIVQNIDADVPFDMRHHRVLKYLSNPAILGE